MKFGEKLRTLRTMKGLTQEQLARSIGITLGAYTAYENNGVYPRKREIYSKLAEALGCDLNYLLTEDEEFITTAGEKYGRTGKQQAEQLVAQLSGLFAGGQLTDEDKDAVMIALQKVYFDCKEDNKKYGRKKKD